MAILTDTKAKHLKPEDKPLPHGGVVGLTLRPSQTKGRGKWVLRYVSPITQKRRNAGLGSYPEVSIADAARNATSMRELLAKGIDPLDEKEKSKNKPKIPLFEEAAKIVHTELLPGWKNQKHAQQWINTLTQYVFPVIGAIPLNQIQSAHVADALRGIWLTKPETASRVKQRIYAIMKWGMARGYCLSNPVDVVDHLLPAQPSKAVRTQHQPAMPWTDIPKFIEKHVYKNEGSDVSRMALEFLILTATRSGEVRGMKWSEVDFTNKIWTIPAERMKAKFQHRVPLSERALHILVGQQGMHETLVFPSPNKQVPLSDMALTSLLRRCKASSDVEGRIATAHGFRSSFRDWCSENGYPRDLAERALAHTVQNAVEAAYHQTDLLEQRRPMMQTWADYVCSKRK